jgi:hypothetical protein
VNIRTAAKRMVVGVTGFDEGDDRLLGRVGEDGSSRLRRHCPERPPEHPLQNIFEDGRLLNEQY